MSARSLKRLTAQPPAPSHPCVLGTFPCIHLAGEHTQSLFSCSDYPANTYRWWCWSHQCWRWHSDPSWNDASWSWLPSLSSRPVRTHTFFCVSLLVVSHRVLFLLRLGASPPGRGEKKKKKRCRSRTLLDAGGPSLATSCSRRGAGEFILTTWFSLCCSFFLFLSSFLTPQQAHFR